MQNLGLPIQEFPTKTLTVFLKPLTYKQNAGVALVDLINEQKKKPFFLTTNAQT